MLSSIVGEESVLRRTPQAVTEDSSDAVMSVTTVVVNIRKDICAADSVHLSHEPLVK